MSEERSEQPGAAQPSRSDQDLTAACCEGDREAFGELVSRYQDRAFNVAFRLTGSPEDAADAVQEAFLKAYRAMARFRRESSFYTWLFRIVVNEVRTRRRFQAARSRVRGIGLNDARAAPRVPPAAAPDPSEEAGAAERKRIIEEALQSLEDREREIIVLRDIEGCGYEEIAAALGCARGTVKSRLHRARTALKEKLLPKLGKE